MEEIKKVEEKKEVKPIVEKIPEDLAKDVDKVQDKKRQLLAEFMQVSISVTNYRNRQDELLVKMKNNGESLRAKIDNAFSKMKLKTRTDIDWQYDGKGNFLGFPKKKPVIDKKSE